MKSCFNSKHLRQWLPHLCLWTTLLVSNSAWATTYDTSTITTMSAGGYFSSANINLQRNFLMYSGLVSDDSGTTGDASDDLLGIGTSSPNERVTIEGILSLDEVAAPTQTSGYGKIYVKSTDSNLYFMDDGGTETQLNSTGAGISIGDSVTSGTTGSVLFVDSGGNLAEDNPNFFWDAVNLSLGVGTMTPNLAGNNSAITLQGSAKTHVEFSVNSDSMSGGDAIGDISWYAGSSNTRVARINADVVGTSEDSARIEFLTATGGSISEAMRIDENGYVGINNNTPSQVLHISGSLAINDSGDASTTCISSDASDRLYHDTDCDEIKDGGEEYIDQTGGSDSDWTEQSSPADYLEAKAGGITANGATLYGTAANTHINLGFGTSVTGTNGQNHGYATIGGGANNTSTEPYATVGGGDSNDATADWATVAGGKGNSAGQQYDSISGGLNNATSGYYNSIGGGYSNETSDWYGTIGGGNDNTASGHTSTIGGGNNNVASANWTTISGGVNNTVDGFYAVVGGGVNNTASGNRALVSGGDSNTASGSYSTIAGGLSNNNAGDYSFVAGRDMHLSGAADRTFVFGHATSGQSITTSDSFLVFPAGDAGNMGIGTDTPAGKLDVTIGSADGVTGIVVSQGEDTLDAVNISASVLTSGDGLEIAVDTDTLTTGQALRILGTSTGSTDVVNIDGTGLIASAVGLDGIGAISLAYGSADITDHTFTADSTGDTEFVVPNDSIGPAELDSTTGDYDFGGVTSLEIPNTTVTGLPAAGTDGRIAIVTDGSDDSDCTTGAGSTYVLCMDNGTAWEPTGDAGSGGGGVSIGDSIGSGTTGSILFVDTSGQLAEDNTSLFWDETLFYLGIGTNAAPSTTLDVEQSGSTKANTDIVEITNSGNGADMDGTETSILFNQAYNGGTIVDAGRISVGTETDWTSTASTQNSYLAFETATSGTVTEYVRINSTGYVGIGTTSPLNYLDVMGGSVFGGTYAGTQTAPTNGLLIEGNVSIGTSDNQNLLDVEGGVAIGATYSGSSTAPTDGLIVEGNVGIGLDTTSMNFEVDGTAGFTPSATASITAGGGITVTDTIMRVQGNGGAVNITANPQIAAGSDGQIVVIQGDHATNTVQLDDGTGLALAGGVSFTMASTDTIVFIYDSGSSLWIELSRSDN